MLVPIVLVSVAIMCQASVSKAPQSWAAFTFALLALLSATIGWPKF